MAKKKYYVVWHGRTPGIYESWDAASQQVNGVAGAKYKAFPTKKAAMAAYSDDWQNYIGQSKQKKQPKRTELHPDVIRDSLSVDAACSGNPGRLEYQVVHTETGEKVLHSLPLYGTNNMGEFLALVDALRLLHDKGDDSTPIYTDSRTARAWVRDRRVKSTLPRDVDTEPVWLLVDDALHWLRTNEYHNDILTWDTKTWGEIPADFGRK